MEIASTLSRPLKYRCSLTAKDGMPEQTRKVMTEPEPEPLVSDCVDGCGEQLRAVGYELLVLARFSNHVSSTVEAMTTGAKLKTSGGSLDDKVCWGLSSLAR